MTKIHQPNPNIFKSYYLRQSQRGAGNLPAFHGVRVQRGYGIGSFLKGLFRTAVPLVKEGARSIGRTALATGMNIANDVLSGQDFKSSAKARALETRNKLKSRTIDAVKSMIDPQKGKGIKRRAVSKTSIPSQIKRRKTPPKSAKASCHKTKKKNKKKKKRESAVRDIFG